MNRNKIVALLLALVGAFIACTPHVQVDVSSPSSTARGAPADEPRVGGYINPNFLGNDITTTGNLKLGTNPATAGRLRFPSGFISNFRNAANSADLRLLETDGSNNLYIGTDSAFTAASQVPGIKLYTTVGGTIAMGINGTTQLFLDSNGVYAYQGTLILGSSAAASAGDIRMRNNRSIKARNAADSADVEVMTVDASNRVVFGANVAGASQIILGQDTSWIANNGELGIQTSGAQPIVITHGGELRFRNAGGEIYERRQGYSVQTTDATVTTIASGTVAQDTMVTIEVDVNGQASTFTAAAGYKRIATVRDTGGILNLVGAVSTPHTAEADPAWDCTVDVNAATWRVRVTGVAATTINWRAAVRLTRNANRRRRRNPWLRQRDVANDNHRKRVAFAA